ncbi:MAG TPA: hypothetical protein GXX30_09495 [Firmicutes bacterium]|uniref:Uncharacterized protein n=1 Tax=Candidatus Fermentithermobacillus carboniphilus TaxID=3085328 RepID=A0AAT9LDM5_9FIRM|nr:MAG: hypothetical protein IMF26_10050 [Candidatus Fermentithermobacillus carboniphilus]HHW19113.1 hypothetical protein [Candidatus Fermentithermobacillaceae bacterium]
MRFRASRTRWKEVVPLIMALLGIGILIVALPAWVWPVLLGLGLIAGAYFVYQNRV